MKINTVFHRRFDFRITCLKYVFFDYRITYNRYRTYTLITKVGVFGGYSDSGTFSNRSFRKNSLILNIFLNITSLFIRVF
ncbi:unnamed protein product [Rhizophagus irregularis]|nr:unnamed protein product [Rhizophagus irregularis]